jgi:predicted Zn-ribbon and HTH transcriptional regulator
MRIKIIFSNLMPRIYSRLAHGQNILRLFSNIRNGDFDFEAISHLLEHFENEDAYFWRMMIKKSRGTHNVECPFCGFIGRFKAWGSPPKWNVRCPICKSRSRHRQLALVLKNMPLSGTLLHFAPEECVTALLKTKRIEYVSADLNAPNVDLKLNIEKTNLPDEQYDTIICSHVLDDVVNDRVALLELRRILKRDGTLIVMVPIVEGCPTTYEDETIISPEEREIHFGYSDDVRLYGADFTQRLRDAGFDVQVHVAFGKEAVRYGLTMGEKIFICRKT